MLTNLIIYRIADSWSPDLQAVEAALAKSPFADCGATQERSAGWVPPRGEPHGPLAESVASQWVMRFMTEAKKGYRAGKPDTPASQPENENQQELPVGGEDEPPTDPNHCEPDARRRLRGGRDRRTGLNHPLNHPRRPRGATKGNP